MLKKLLVNVVYFVFILGFVWISGQLFFEEKTNQFFAYAKGQFFAEVPYTGPKIKNFRVVYPDEPASLEPTLADPVTRQRLINIYEPLVKADRDLKMRPALAVSWGLLDQYTWEFRLRPDVVFHDGSIFNADDVIASINRAKEYSGSELKDILASIEEVTKVDDLTLKVKTFKPDPLLLQRLSSVLVIPSENQKQDNFLSVGTASYSFASWNKGENIELERFENYWGKEARFEKVTLIPKINKFERVQMLIDGEANLLAFVPFDAAEFVKQQGFTIASIPSLEVQFLIFNFDSELLADVDARRAVSLAIDTDVLAQALGSYARPVNQFVSNGIFGFNPDIEDHEYDLEKAEILAKSSDLGGKTLKFHLAKGLDVLGEHVRTQLNEIGMSVIVSYLEPDKLWDSILNSEADLYFLGFKADLGDAGDFFDIVIHEDGSFNVANYFDKVVDELIDASQIEMDPEKRLLALQEIMRLIVSEDVIGVPLFEYETLYAFPDDLEMQPRIDGFLYFDELLPK